MSSSARCRHIKVNGTQCGSPALRGKNFCFYHQTNRAATVEWYCKESRIISEISLPVFEDAHSVQGVVRQVVGMLLQNRLEKKTAGLMLYALQIASSNLKRMALEKPQPEQVVTEVEKDEKTEFPIAAAETVSANSPAAHPASQASTVTRSTELGEYIERSEGDEALPPGTIQACHRPGPHRVPQVRARILGANLGVVKPAQNTAIHTAG
jgi:hypothetical protein